MSTTITNDIPTPEQLSAARAELANPYSGIDWKGTAPLLLDTIEALRAQLAVAQTNVAALSAEGKRLDAYYWEAKADNAALVGAIQQAWESIDAARIGIPSKIWNSIQPLFELRDQPHPGAQLLEELALTKSAADVLGPLLSLIEGAQAVQELDGNQIGIELIPEHHEVFWDACKAANALDDFRVQGGLIS